MGGCWRKKLLAPTLSARRTRKSADWRCWAGRSGRSGHRLRSTPSIWPTNLKPTGTGNPKAAEGRRTPERSARICELIATAEAGYLKRAQRLGVRRPSAAFSTERPKPARKHPFIQGRRTQFFCRCENGGDHPVAIMRLFGI